MKSTKKKPVLVWHYTTGQRAEQILQCGFIRGATVNVPLNERPAVWFSMNQVFELTAAKTRRVDGVLMFLTIPEMAHYGNGLVRFGLSPRALLNGDNLRRRARISGSEWIRIQKIGTQRGADPHDWYGSIEVIDVSLCAFEVMSKSGLWEPFAPSEWLIQAANSEPVL